MVRIVKFINQNKVIIGCAIALTIAGILPGWTDIAKSAPIYIDLVKCNSDVVKNPLEDCQVIANRTFLGIALENQKNGKILIIPTNVLKRNPKIQNNYVRLSQPVSKYLDGKIAITTNAEYIPIPTYKTIYPNPLVDLGNGLTAVDSWMLDQYPFITPTVNEGKWDEVYAAAELFVHTPIDISPPQINETFQVSNIGFLLHQKEKLSHLNEIDRRENVTCASFDTLSNLGQITINNYLPNNLFNDFNGTNISGIYRKNEILGRGNSSSTFENSRVIGIIILNNDSSSNQSDNNYLFSFVTVVPDSPTGNLIDKFHHPYVR
jgi:hypothetical protein